jgi:type VI secretion system protein ImpG
MEELLPHYERELAFLRGQAKEFAARYPKIAGRLMMTGDVAEDPHVERMIESFALLAARVQKRLDDDFPLFTETFLDVLYPHYLRPFPSCSIVQMDPGGSAAQLTAPVTIERGTVLSARPVRGVTCKFRTAWDAELLPVQITQAGFRGVLNAPEGTLLPPLATTALSVTVELTTAQAGWETLQRKSLRVYLDGEPSVVSAVREAVCARVVGVVAQASPHGPWRGMAGRLPALVGFADDESLLDWDARSHPAYRLLTEYFAFPEKFNFIDIPLPPWLKECRGTSITLHLLMAGVRADSNEGRLLETVTAKNFVLGCTPVVNLFRQHADPIRVTHTASSYPLVADARRAFGYEIYAVDSVHRVQQTPQGESIVEFRPFYSLRHDDLAADAGHYWTLHRDDSIAAHSPGYEMEMSIVDIDFDPAAPQTDTLSVELTCTNRDLPAQMAYGVPGGDLFGEGGGTARSARLLRKPTATVRFERGRGALWRLISHLSLNHLSLSGSGVDALKELLRLYDLPRTASNSRQVDGLRAVDYRPATAWLAGKPFATFARGIEVRLTVDEESFVGAGLQLFAQVMDRFFGLYVHANSFTQLVVLSHRTGEEVLRCQPRSGDGPLA